MNHLILIGILLSSAVGGVYGLYMANEQNQVFEDKMQALIAEMESGEKSPDDVWFQGHQEYIEAKMEIPFTVLQIVGIIGGGSVATLIVDSRMNRAAKESENKE